MSARQLSPERINSVTSDAAASPATGSLKHHKYEQEQIVRQAIEARELSAAGVRV